MIKKILFSLFAALLLTGPAWAENPLPTPQEKEPDFKFSGHIQVRTEIDNRDFSNSTAPLFFTSMKTTLGIEKTFFEKIKLFAQIRDSRIYGEEVNTLTSLKNLDLHQGFLQINKPFEIPLSLQIGRFEVSYGTQRFLGPGAWHYNGRSFDGLRLMYSQEALDFKTDLFALTHNASSGYIGNATPAAYQNINPLGFNIYGFWSSLKVLPALEGALFGMYEDNQKRTETGIPELSRATAGINYKGEYGAFSSIVEAAYQFGKTRNLNINAYLLSGQGFYSIGDFKLGLGADILSGNDTKSLATNNSFAVPYGTNHIFYGFMDYFIDMPGNTKNLGLNDFYLTSAWKREGFPLSATFNLHHFMSNQREINNLSTYGQEGDLVLSYKLFENTTISLGNSILIPGELMKSAQFFGITKTDLSYWGYLMVTANF